MLPIWYKAVKEVKVKVDTDKKTIPMLGIGTSLSFLIMMFNLPAPGGTSAHAVGGSANCYIVRTLGLLFSS